MLLTTIASVAFVALTGLHEEQRIFTRPKDSDVFLATSYYTHASEVATIEYLDFATSVSMYENLLTKRELITVPGVRKGKKNKEVITEEQAQANLMYDTMMHYLCMEAREKPTYLAYSTYYSVARKGSNWEPNYDKKIGYTEFKFVNDDGLIGTFVFADDLDLEGLAEEENVFVYDALKNLEVLDNFWTLVAEYNPLKAHYKKFSLEKSADADFSSNKWFSVVDTALDMSLATLYADKYYTDTTVNSGNGENQQGTMSFLDILYPIIDYLLWLHSIGVWERTGIDFKDQINVMEVGIDQDLFKDDWKNGIVVVNNPFTNSGSAGTMGIIDILFPILDILLQWHYMGYWEYEAIDIGAQVLTVKDGIEAGKAAVAKLKQNDWVGANFAKITVLQVASPRIYDKNFGTTLDSDTYSKIETNIDNPKSLFQAIMTK